jgi:hypothetical protein
MPMAKIYHSIFGFAWKEVKQRGSQNCGLHAIYFYAGIERGRVVRRRDQLCARKYFQICCKAFLAP